MGSGLKRIINRIKEELKATKEVARVLTLRDALATFMAKVDIQIMVHNGHVETPRIKKHLIRKHEVMNRYFDNIFENFSINEESSNQEANSKKYEQCIWVCWWQGLENAPEIVKTCIESIKQNAGNHQVIVVTDENVNSFVSFPDWIIKKKDEGLITKTHISDLLRIELLAKWGGIWLDATFYCTKSLEPYFNMPVWSIKRPDYRHVSVSCGYFANYSLGCDIEHRDVFAAIEKYLLEYWHRYDYMIDYLFLDYLIVQAEKHSERVGNAFKAILPNNPECDELYKVLGQPYDDDLWKRLNADTGLYKLSWKSHFPIEINGRITFYGKLVGAKVN